MPMFSMNCEWYICWQSRNPIESRFFYGCDEGEIGYLFMLAQSLIGRRMSLHDKVVAGSH